MEVLLCVHMFSGGHFQGTCVTTRPAFNLAFLRFPKLNGDLVELCMGCYSKLCSTCIYMHVS